MQDVLRLLLTPDQIKLTEALLKHKKVMVLSCHSSGKCLSRHSFVYLPSGDKIKVEKLVNKNFKLLTTTEHGIKEVDARAEYNKDEPIYRIITESGKKIEANEQHPLYKSTIKNQKIEKVYGWTKLGELSTGDYLLLSSEYPCFGNDSPKNEKYLKYLPYVLINVYENDGELFFRWNSKRELSDEVKNLFDLSTPVESKNDHANAYPINTDIHDYLKNTGNIRSFKNRKLPEYLFTYKKDYLKIFIKSLFSIQSNTLVVKNRYETKIKLFHRSEKLLKDIGFILNKFGILYKIYKKDNGFWTLRILNVEKFIRVFEFDGFDHLVKNNPDNKLNWRFTEALPNTYWEKIISIEPIGNEMTVAINVPEHETYLSEFFEHNSYWAAGMANWNFDAFEKSITLTAGPSYDAVRNTIWQEIRNHSEKVPPDLREGILLPKDTRMDGGIGHYVEDFVPGGQAASRGRKSDRFLMIFEEADGIPPHLFEAARGMLLGKENLWVCLLNPIDPTSQAKIEYDEQNFHNIHISALDHPNIITELLGLPKPFPGINMNVDWISEWMRQGCREVDPSQRKSWDIEWPPKTVKWNGEIFEVTKYPRYWRPKPGSQVQPRVLGQWPTNSDVALWNDAMWMECMKPRPESDGPIEIGCDPSGGGSDAASFVVRRGITALDHEKYYNWDSKEIAAHCKALATKWGNKVGMNPKDVIIRVDCTGSNAVYDQRDDYNFIRVIYNGKPRAEKKDEYTNKRSELWLETRDKAETLVEDENTGELHTLIDLSRLKPESLKLLKTQLQTAKFFPRAGGKREVEKKEDMKKKLKNESPDDADAFNLAFSDDYGEGSVVTKFSKTAIKQMTRGYGSRYRR